MSQSKSYAIRLTVSAVLEAGLETTRSRRLSHAVYIHATFWAVCQIKFAGVIPRATCLTESETGGGREKYSAFPLSYPCGLEIRVFSPHRHCDDFVMIHYFEAFSQCIIARLLFLHSSSLSWLHHSSVQTESCNYPDCHLIAAPLSAASPRTSPFYITQIQRERERERERDVMIAFWAGISLNFTMFLIHPIISSQCPAFSIHFSFFCRSRCDVWHKTESHSVFFTFRMFYMVSVFWL